MPIDKNDPKFQAFAKSMRENVGKYPEGEPPISPEEEEARLNALRQLAAQKAAQPVQSPQVQYDTPLTPEEIRAREILKRKYQLGQFTGQ